MFSIKKEILERETPHDNSFNLKEGNKIISMANALRKKLIQNNSKLLSFYEKSEKYQKILLNTNIIFKNKIINSSNYIKRKICLPKLIAIPVGNYYLTVKKHFRKEEEEDIFFFKNLGDEKIDQVNKASRKVHKVLKEIEKEEKSSENVQDEVPENKSDNYLEDPTYSNGILKSETCSEISSFSSDKSINDHDNFSDRLFENFSENSLNDDLITNMILLSIIKNLPYSVTIDLTNEDNNSEYLNINAITYTKKLNFSELFTELTVIKEFKSVKIETIKKRIKKLHSRIFHNSDDKTSKINESLNFFYLSCTHQEKKKFNNIVGTYKQLYCPRCFVYDCKIHCITGEKHFDNGSSYDIREYLKSYRDMIESAYLATSNNEKREFDVCIRNKIEEYNNEICKKWSYIKDMARLRVISEKTTNTDTNCTKVTNPQQIYDYSVSNCSKFCYKIFLSNLNPAKSNEIYKSYKSHQIDFIRTLYFKKLFQIFKFDPCSIYMTMKCIRKESEIKILELCECSNVFIMLLDIKIEDLLIKHRDYITTLYKALHNKKYPKKANAISLVRLKNIQEASRKNIVHEYNPCIHKGNEICGDSCTCASRGYCEKNCVCNPLLCSSKFKGCVCDSICSSSICPCYANGRECDPELCKKCCLDPDISKIDSSTNQIFNINSNSICINQSYSYKNFKRLAISHSTIQGWGLFTLEKIKKNELIAEYLGEMLEEKEVRKREIWNDIEEVTYMFKLTETCTVDSKFIGNKIRFANHSKARANSYAKIVFAQGDYRVCLYAKSNIEKYEEILFDYDGQNVLGRKFAWINDKRGFINKKNDNLSYSKNVPATITKKRDRAGNFKCVDSNFLMINGEAHETKNNSADKNLRRLSNDDTRMISYIKY